MSHYSTKKQESQHEFVVCYKKVVLQGSKIVDVIKLSFRPRILIKKISKKYYIRGRIIQYETRIVRTYWEDEVFEFKNHKKETGTVSYRTMRKKFVDLRYLIATNFSGAKNELFLTLTYTGDRQTNDPKIVHHDFKNFFKRMKLDPLFKNAELEYINIVEPHASGNWHMHTLIKSANGTDLNALKFPRSDENYNMSLGVYIHNQIWKLGAVTIRTLNCDHIGAYFIAYLSNAELTPLQADKYEAEADVKVVIDPADGREKKYIKGNRMHYYHEYMQVYRHSKGIKKATEYAFEHDQDDQDDSYTVGLKKTWGNTVKIALENDKNLYICREQYKSDKEIYGGKI